MCKLCTSSLLSSPDTALDLVNGMEGMSFVIQTNHGPCIWRLNWELADETWSLIQCTYDACVCMHTIPGP